MNKPSIEQVLADVRSTIKYEKFICMDCKKTAKREVHIYCKAQKRCIACQDKRNYELAKGRMKKKKESE